VYGRDRLFCTNQENDMWFIDSVCDTFGSVYDAVKENPGKSLAVAAVTIASGGTALAFAGPIAATLGSTGVLGAASTGTLISGLSGASLASASTAVFGGGSVLSGGGGVALGSKVIGAAGAAVGAGASGGLSMRA
jgi:hypothetical protein